MKYLCTDEFENDYPSEAEIALENGCFVDDDGNWIPIEDAEDYGLDPEVLYELGYDPEGRLYDEDDDYDGEIDDWEEWNSTTGSMTKKHATDRMTPP